MTRSDSSRQTAVEKPAAKANDKSESTTSTRKPNINSGI